MKPPPLMFSWGIYELFRSYSKEYQWSAASVLALVLNSNNSLTGYEQLKLISCLPEYFVLFTLLEVL